MADNKKNKVWLYVGIGCGSLLLVALIAVVSGVFWFRGKVKQAGGPQAIATQMITMGGGILAVPALPPEEREEARQVITDLNEKAKGFTKDDVKELASAMERLSKAQKASPDGKPSADDARAFIADCKRIAEKH